MCSPSPARRRLVATRSVVGLRPLTPGAGLLKAFRRTIRESDVPPTELAKRKLAQALADATAGAAADIGNQLDVRRYAAGVTPISL